MKIKALLAVLVLAASIVILGYVSIRESSYNDVGSLKELSAPTRVTVTGDLVDLGDGILLMNYKGGTYTLEARGVYAIAQGPEGEYAVFLLKGGNGFMVVALYPASEFVSKYGGSPLFEEKVIVQGIYMPGETVVIGLPSPDGVKPLYEAPLLKVDAILKGCHSSYQQRQASITG
ncbi:MAG: hypothetical protein F7B17_02880 [Desulfurococcales archaeon]|nr:hypothetical protein [Desulfurococcales archaeon]